MLNTGSFFASLLLVLAATEGSGVVIQGNISCFYDHGFKLPKLFRI